MNSLSCTLIYCPPRVEDEQTIDSGTLKQKDLDENGSQRTIVGSTMSTSSKRSSGSGTSTSGLPEIKYARPVK